MQNLPLYLPILFGAITLVTVIMFYKAANSSLKVLLVVTAWLALQTIIGLTGFYTKTDSVPPRFSLLILPPMLLILSLLLSVGGRRFLDGLSMRWLTFLHVVRIPVEMVLLGLFINGLVPGIMTFEGRNFDILSGISAPVVYYLVFVKKWSRKLLLAWNIICLLLLINIVVIAILSAPFSFQQFGFGQPNLALLHFPFVWLPCCVVPIVLLSHVASIRKLLAAEPVKSKAARVEASC